MSANIHSLHLGLRTRYIGHHLLTENGGGILSFSLDQPELEQLMTCACNGKSTDIPVVNSGHQDFAGELRAYKRDERLSEHEEFASLLFKLGLRLGKIASTGVKVVWKGNYGGLAQQNPWLDTVAQMIMTSQRVLFADCKTIANK